MALLLFGLPTVARADAGQIRLNETHGEYRVTVFSAPTPLRAGPVDLSVLILESRSGKPIENAMVFLELTSAGGLRLQQRPTKEMATNALFQAAKFELPAAGIWNVSVRVQVGELEFSSRFEMKAAEPMARWLDLWPWIAFPMVPIVVYGLLQLRRRVLMNAG